MNLDSLSWAGAEPCGRQLPPALRGPIPSHSQKPAFSLRGQFFSGCRDGCRGGARAGVSSCPGTWESLHHITIILPGRSSPLLQAPCFHGPSWTKSVLRSLGSGRFPERSWKPALPSGGYSPSLVPICPIPHLLCPQGTCPLPVFSAITPWALEPYSPLQPPRLPRLPSTAQLAWTQTPRP